MFSQRWNNLKRGRDAEEETAVEDEHRIKRRLQDLPTRASPKLPQQYAIAPVPYGGNYTSQPAPPTITPADSDSEEIAASAEPRSFFSPFSSATPTPTNHGQHDPFAGSVDHFSSSQSTQMSDVLTSDDFEMTDSVHTSPRSSFQNNMSPAISGRIPTPIHSSFAPSVRAQKAATYYDADADDEAIVSRFMRGRRLPSPISEGEMSPSVIAAGLGEMQMEVDTSGPQEPERETPTKKGHTRSKHSLRQWTGNSGYGGGDMNSSMKRTFSMGYRSDCEKCQKRIPGHFSHIITY